MLQWSVTMRPTTATHKACSTCLLIFSLLAHSRDSGASSSALCTDLSLAWRMCCRQGADGKQVIAINLNGDIASDDISFVHNIFAILSNIRCMLLQAGP